MSQTRMPVPESGTPHPTAVLHLRLLSVMALSAVLLSAYVALAYVAQLPLEAHAFRQTQTALTAFWFQHGGVRLDYETPVGGPPWAIPFEFPLYQWLVAKLSSALGIPLAVAGRGISYAFLLACVPVAWRVNRRLGFGPASFLIFVMLVFTSPQYLFWGRSVMIETAALFFTLLALSFCLDFLLGGNRRRDLCLFSLTMTLALLQKITTGLPVWLILGLVAAVMRFGAWRKGGALRFGDLAFIAACFAVPLLAGVGWAQYTDQIKSLNPLGQALTSAALSKWNWGTGVQRLSPEFWVTLVWMRIVIGNLGSIFGLVLLAYALSRDARSSDPRSSDARLSDGRARATMLVAFAMGVLPLFMFTNLHIVHDYYQTSCLIFLFAVLAVSAAQVMKRPRRAGIALVLVLGVAGTNAVVFFARQFPLVQAGFGPEDRDVAIGGILKRELPADGQFVAFGNGWSSTFSYLSERRSFTVPDWFVDFDRAASEPEAYVDAGKLGAVVTCAPRPTIWEMVAAAPRRGWKVAEVAGCHIALPAKPAPVRMEEGACKGAVTKAAVEDRGGRRAIVLSGWAAPAEADAAGGEVFLSLQAAGAPALLVDTLRVPDLAANSAMDRPDAADLGFSRVLEGGVPAGGYTVRIVQQVGDAYRLCPMQVSLKVE